MENLKEILNEICYLYYPKNMYEFDSNYLETKESKKLLKRIYSSNLNELDALTKDIDSIYKNASNFKMGRNFPSYIIQIDLESSENSKTVIMIYISLLVPYFTLVILKGNYSNYSIEVDLDKEKKEKKLIDSLKSYISEQIKFNEFERKILNDRIPMIKISENFTYFNAFFADAHRINNF